MDFSKRQADPRQHLIGIFFVVLFHALIVYALVTGLATKVVDRVRAPVETKLIEEVRKPTPPPKAVVPPPPRLEAPPPLLIPPPEVLIAMPPPVQAPMAAIPAERPPAPAVMAPVAPPAAAPEPPAPAPPATTRAACTIMPTPEIPGVNISGRVTMLGRISVKAGKVVSVDISNIRGTSDRRAQRALAASVEAAMRDYSCPGDWPALTQEFVFNIN